MRKNIFRPHVAISVDAKVPGGVYGSLMDAGKLSKGDFYYRYNDINYRFVSYENWTYETLFTVPDELLMEYRITLEFSGIDTRSLVLLNGKELGSTDNMFVEYSFDIKHLLNRGHNQNNLSIRIQSPVDWSKKEYDKQLLKYQVPPKCVDPAFRGECHVNHIRKMQSSFGWDWGPAFPNLGIWKPMKIVGWKTITVKSILFTAIPVFKEVHQNNSIEDANWKVDLKIFFDSAFTEKKLIGELEIMLNNTTYVNKNLTISSVDILHGHNEGFTISKKIVEIWWPNGYGSQPLYNLTVRWTFKKEISEKTIRVGFRTVELDQSYVNEINQSEGKFKINNVTMFLKGSNWIPAHVLNERATSEYKRQLLQDAAATHQNCIRVWGGGIYESDEFYEAADELGILVWQDFMFACSMYPTEDRFLSTVKAEVEDQVKRLQHHSSILSWAGNNENEAALRGNWYGTGLNFTLYQNDYIKLYVDTIQNVTKSLDNSRPFIVSSPSNGIESEEENYVAINPYDNKYGDVHYYNYMLDGWNWQIYPRTRFASEYGFQSWPSYISMSEVTKDRDRFINSPLMKHRQHHPLGNIQLKWQLLRHFNANKFLKKDLHSYKYYLYLTQVEQAMAVQTETEFYRRGMNRLDSKGLGYTSGALYWQLNDIWQGASWSSLEFGGRWKMLHYFAAKFFSPLLLSPEIKGNKVRLFLINDMMHDTYNLSVTIRIRSFLQLEPLSYLQFNVNSTGLSNQVVATYDIEKDLNFFDTCHSIIYHPKSACFLSFDLSSSHEKQLEKQESFQFLSSPRDFNLKKAKIQIVRTVVLNDFNYNIVLQTNEVALFVWLETKVRGIFSDNGFHMTNELKDIGFIARENTTIKELSESLHVTSLSDTFNVEKSEEYLFKNLFYNFKNHENHIDRILERN